MNTQNGGHENKSCFWRSAMKNMIFWTSFEVKNSDDDINDFVPSIGSSVLNSKVVPSDDDDTQQKWKKMDQNVVLISEQL